MQYFRHPVRLLAVVAVAVTACGDSPPTLSEAFCNDLRNGANAAFIIRDGEPSERADLAFGFAAISCPEQLRTNEGLRNYLEAWNINPDA